MTAGKMKVWTAVVAFLLLGRSRGLVTDETADSASCTGENHAPLFVKLRTTAYLQLYKTAAVCAPCVLFHIDL